MIQFANAKINLGLCITRKREDGYHDLETVFYPIPLKDVIECKVADQMGFTLHGKQIPGNPADNLILKAWHLLKKEFPQLPCLDIHLLKNIPTGAGLGGGSADGAFMLRLLNEKFELNLTTENLIEYALQLGSDCPFFILNTPCSALGRGEILHPIHLDLSDCQCILIKPEVHVSTAWAFSNIQPGQSSNSPIQVIQQPMDTWKQHLVNDFEQPIFKAYPFMQEIKNTLYEAGALYSALSGTGSVIYGLFDREADIQKITQAPVFSPHEVYCLSSMA